MFFLLSKTLGLMLLPSNFLIGIGLLGALMLLTRLSGIGRGLLTISVVGLAVCGFSPLGSWLFYPLEQRFPPWDPTQGAPDGIVVLGGGIDSDPSATRGTAVFTGSAGRVIAAAALARRYPKARVLYSGGSANLVAADAARESDFAATVLQSLGVSPDRLTLERDSRNTFENAEFSKAMAAPRAGQRWLLVTSAYHMPRSVGIFRKVGFAVEPYPVDWRLGGPADLRRFPPLSAEGLMMTDIAAREWMGLFAYWFAGRTSALFPGPIPP